MGKVVSCYIERPRSAKNELANNIVITDSDTKEYQNQMLELMNSNKEAVLTFYGSINLYKILAFLIENSQDYFKISGECFPAKLSNAIIKKQFNNSSTINEKFIISDLTTFGRYVDEYDLYNSEHTKIKYRTTGNKQDVIFLSDARIALEKEEDNKSVKTVPVYKIWFNNSNSFQRISNKFSGLFASGITPNKYDTLLNLSLNNELSHPQQELTSKIDSLQDNISSVGTWQMISTDSVLSNSLVDKIDTIDMDSINKRFEEMTEKIHSITENLNAIYDNTKKQKKVIIRYVIQNTNETLDVSGYEIKEIRATGNTEPTYGFVTIDEAENALRIIKETISKINHMRQYNITETVRNVSSTPLNRLRRI